MHIVKSQSLNVEMPNIMWRMEIAQGDGIWVEGTSRLPSPLQWYHHPHRQAPLMEITIEVMTFRYSRTSANGYISMMATSLQRSVQRKLCPIARG